MSPAVLCHTCRGCLHHREGLMTYPGNERTEQLFIHHTKVGDIAKSAAQDCPVCRSLWKQLGPLEQHMMAVAPDEYVTCLMLQPSVAFTGAFDLAVLPNEKYVTINGIVRASLLFFLLEEKRDIMPYCTSKEPSASTGSDQCWHLSMKWLDRCISEHDHLVDRSEPEWHPTRLLDVDSSGHHVKLVESDKIYPTGHYITLSHRWAEAGMAKLTKKTFEAMLRGIETSNWPLAFRQAIDIARRLKVRYLWIDSLCIFQDDEDKSDWAVEALLMNKVYSHSFINIAATGSVDASQGLFKTRKFEVDVMLPEIQVCAALTGGSESEMLKTYVLSDFLFLESELQHAPLNRRGWVLQERLLAPRVLHFGTTQLFWECSEMLLYETFPSILAPSMKKLTATTFKSMDINKVKPGGGLMTKFNLWDRVVRAYSSCALSFESDKVIALSGIATVFASILQDEYIAGMWRTCLESQLVWYVDDTMQANFEPSFRPSRYRAPTWSWLSVEGRITGGRYLADGSQIKVKDVELEYLHKDAMGMIKAGYLILDCRLQRLKLIQKMVSITESDMRPISGQWTMTMAGRRLEHFRDQGKPWNTTPVVVALDVPATEQGLAQFDLYATSAGGPWDTRDNPFTNGDTDHFHHILLLQCVDRSNGTFSRIGIAYFSAEDSPELYDMTRFDDPEEGTLPCLNFDAATHRHLLKLI